MLIYFIDNNHAMLSNFRLIRVTKASLHRISRLSFNKEYKITFLNDSDTDKMFRVLYISRQ